MEYTTAEVAALPVQLSRCAWTGGSPPPPYRAMPQRMRALVRADFRDQLRASVAAWGDGAALAGSTLAAARIYWRRAKADAHATVRRAVAQARGDQFT